jgi:hypothetical protein
MTVERMEPPTAPAHRQEWPYVVLIAGFTAALCWLGVTFMVLSNDGSMVLFVVLVVPMAATFATYLAVRRYAKRSIDSAPRLKHKHLASSPPPRKDVGMYVVILASFTAALCWVGAFMVLTTAGYGPATVLGVVPTLATIWCYLAFRRAEQDP